jgi:glycosyltransferase involved in cell wall biosynthesis
MIRTANLVGSVSRKAGGLHESVRRLVQFLSKLGVGVRVLTVEDEFTAPDLAVWEPVPVDVFSATWPRGFGYSPGFIKVLNEYRPDLTHTHGIWMYPSIATAVYCTRRRVPYMISAHGMLDPWAVRHHRWKKVVAYAIFETNHVHGARCIRALCESEASAIRRLKLKNPIAVIPNGVDLPELAEVPSDEGAGLSQLAHSGRKVLLFLGRIHRKKGLSNLLKAWAEVQKPQARNEKRDEWLLVIAGWDEDGYEAQLKRLARDVGLQVTDTSDQPLHSATTATTTASVIFAGPRFGTDKDAMFRACDAFVLPSLSEGLPMAVLEAWAYAKPVLMTPECNLPEGFDADAALRIDTTVKGILSGLRLLREMPEVTLSETGMRGRILVEKRFAWPEIARQVKVTYEWMLGGASAPHWMFN